jgi:hypothetical protein
MSFEGKTCSNKLNSWKLAYCTLKSQNWKDGSPPSLEQAKVDLAEIEGLLEEAKAKLRAGD